MQRAKAHAIPALNFTNLISARPLFGVAGAGSLAQVVNAAIAGKARFDTMRDFFEGVGEGDTAGIWQNEPVPQPGFREKFRKAAAAQAGKRKSEEMV